MSLSNLLEFSVRMKDMMSGGLAKLASTAQNTFSKVQSNIDKVTGKNKLLSASFDEITARIKQTEQTINSSKIPSQIREARRELEQLNKMRDTATRQTGGGGSSSGGGGFLGGMLRQALPVVGIAGAMALGGQLLNSGMNAQARQASFNVLAGTEQGTKLNAGLTKYAQDSIYGTEVHDNAKTMLGFGIAAKEVLPNIKMLGDVAMGDANKLQSLTLAFSQVSAGGKLTGQDMLQFINAGFNPLNEIAKMTGKSMSTLKDEMSQGAISANMVKAAFQHATSEGGQFYKMADTIANTDFGKWQAFQGQLDALKEKIGGKLAPVLGNLITNYLVPFLNIMQDVGHWVIQNSDWLGILTVSMGTLVLGLMAWHWWTKLVIAETTIATTVIGIFNAVMAMNPIAIVVIAIAALVAGIVIAAYKFEAFRKVLYGLWGSFKQIFTNIGNFFKQIFDPIFKAIDHIENKRWGAAAKEVGKLAYNLSPVGMVANAATFAANGGLTKDVAKQYELESLKGIRKKETSKKATDVAKPAGTDLKGVFDGLKGYKGKGEGEELAKGITSGGARVINMNGVKFAEKIEFHVANMNEGAEQALGTVEDWFLRVLNSGASLQ